MEKMTQYDHAFEKKICQYDQYSIFLSKKKKKSNNQLNVYSNELIT